MRGKVTLRSWAAGGGWEKKSTAFHYDIKIELREMLYSDPTAVVLGGS